MTRFNLDVAALARSYGMRPSDADLETYTTLVGGALASYDAVEELYGAIAPTVPQGRSGSRPDDADSPLGAWYVRTEITGAADGPLAGYSPGAGGAVCAVCLTTAGGFRLAPGGIEAIESLLERPLEPVLLAPAAAANALRVVEETYAHHGGFRLRTLSSA